MVVGAGEEDAPFLGQRLHGIPARALHVLLDDLGRGDGIVRLRVEPHEEAAIPPIGGPLEELLLQVDRDIGQLAEARRDGHQAIFDVAAARHGVHAAPEGLPAIEGFFFFADLREQPREAHLEVLAAALGAACFLQRLHHLDGLLLLAEPLVCLRQLGAGHSVRRGHLVHARELPLGFVEAAAILVEAMQEQQAGVAPATAACDRLLGGLHGDVVETKAEQRLGSVMR